MSSSDRGPRKATGGELLVSSRVSAPEFVRIPEGWFEMGCSSGRDDERPVHRVWVDAFDLAARQVTNADYALFLAASGHPAPRHWSDPAFNDPQQPVVAASWFDAAAYCDWLSRSRGGRYRLPTEAEWERAARGGVEGKLFTWGDSAPETQPGYSARWKNGPERVAQVPPNAYGLFDIGDNVHEWCADWYDAAYYARAPERNPQGPRSGSRRSSRGGSWRHHIKIARVAARSSIPPEFEYADFGFRVART
ncbi:MAG: formylglycine-generating enzyme family protein [Candidatus Acidiferrales bacterium]